MAALCWAVLALTGCPEDEGDGDGGGFETGLAPGVWAASEDEDVLFTRGASRRAEGLEALAEYGYPMPVAAGRDCARGVFAVPIGDWIARPAWPGEAFVEVVHAEPGQTLTFATMIVATNDLIIAPSRRSSSSTRRASRSRPETSPAA